jgi:hypothetical protein
MDLMAVPLIGSRSMKIADLTDMDSECVALCEAINLYSPNIRTIESCCGHGERPYKIWLRVAPKGLADLPDILYYFDSCHSGRPGWRCTVYTDCAMSPVVFQIKGPVGDQAYEDAEAISGLIKAHFLEEEESLDGTD